MINSPFSLIRFFDPKIFLDRTGRWLCHAEAEHNLLLGLADQLIRHPSAGPAPYLAAIEDGDGSILATAISTDHSRLALSRATPGEITEMFALDLVQAGIEIETVRGPFEAVAGFGERWTQVKDCAAHSLERQGVYELKTVKHPSYSPGEMRVATAEDAELLASWAFGFSFEIGHEAEFESCQAQVNGLIEDAALYVWDHRGPVCMAAVSRYTPRGACISLVFTPSDMRGRGYATSLTAEISQKLLDGGREFCCLFTQMDNPTSNDIYQKIGYRQVAEWESLAFV